MHLLIFLTTRIQYGWILKVERFLNDYCFWILQVDPGPVGPWLPFDAGSGRRPGVGRETSRGESYPGGLRRVRAVRLTIMFGVLVLRPTAGLGALSR